jgi:diketogulonate reductase-like aldo/keto reductase
LTQTLARLNLETLDVYLLHNPEHYLQPSKSLQQFDACLEEAFTCLEKEVARGRIQFYGVSSNAWSRDNIDIDRMMNIAKKGKYFPSWLIAD